MSLRGIRARRRPLAGRPPARGAVAAVTLGVLAGLAGGAHAQLGDVGEKLAVDTDHTPRAKISARWSWYAGARYHADGPKPADVPAKSVTPFELDFFDVGFLDSGHGFAGGAICRERFEGEGMEVAAQVRTCERVPALYEYSPDDVGDSDWRPVDLGESAERRGYIGTIVWLDAEHVLAVGGTGCYPRREADCPDGKSAEGDDPRAGLARAWLYQDWDGSGRPQWRELSDLPPAMRGLTALAAEPAALCRDGGGEKPVEVQWGCAAAGGLRQIWHFRDGVFFKGWSSDGSTQLEVVRPELFRFRVRDISGSTAVTAGCCAQDPSRANGPRTLSYDGTTWVVPAGQGDAGSQAYDPLHAESEKHQRPGGAAWGAVVKQPLPLLGRSPYDAAGQYAADGGPCRVDATPWWRCGRDVYAPLEPVTGVSWPLPNPLPAAPENPAEEQDGRVDEAYGSGFGQLADAAEPYRPVGVNPAQTADTQSQIQTPDSYYAIGLLSAGGPEPGPAGDEPASQLAGGACCPLLSSARLVARDVTPATGGVEAIGELRASGQGLAFGPPEGVPPDRSHQALHACNFGLDSPGCDPSVNRFVDNQRSLRLFTLPSYGLNSVDVVDQTPTVGGGGWAVGDYGAILSVAGESAGALQAQEPPAAKLGSRRGRGLDTGPYDAFRAAPTAAPGTVPPLASRPFEPIEPRFRPVGSPFRYGSAAATVGSIAISRDGTEGWAVGSGNVFHFDGGSWTLCSAGGSLPMCPDGLELAILARVPLERDGNPDNDDDFEVLASDGRFGIARYRDGSWVRDDGATQDLKQAFAGFSGSLEALAFGTPGDGWAVGRDGFGNPGIFRLDSEGWVRCTASNRIRCGDPDARLPFSRNDLQRASPFRAVRMVAAGERVYLLATRQPALAASGGGPLSPMIIYREPGGVWRGSADGSDGGYDPGCATHGKDPFGAARCEPAATDTGTANRGAVFSLAVAPTDDGGDFEGWAVGEFGGEGAQARTSILRLHGGRWSQWREQDASADYLEPGTRLTRAIEPRHQATLSAPLGGSGAFLFGPELPLLAFDERRERWEGLPAPFLTSGAMRNGPWKGSVSLVAADGEGGLWAPVVQRSICGLCDLPLTFYRYGDREPRPVFREFPNPVAGREIVTTAAGGDGSFWVADAVTLNRYDRLTGWDRVGIPGWDPGRTVTRPSRVDAVAVGHDGRGIAVGAAGRIARIGPDGAELDPAAGTVCDVAAPVAPCGTGRDLTRAAVASDGSAVAAGANVLLWRPAGGEFRRIEGPRVSRQDTQVAALAFPGPDRIYLALGRQPQLHVGERSEHGWSWRAEATGHRIQALALDERGHGYAVAGNVVLERSGDGDGRWRRIEHSLDTEFQTVAIPPVGGPGALIGAEGGLLLTVQGGRLEVARPVEPFSPLGTGKVTISSVIGLALNPGPASGDLEAWAVVQEPRADVYSRRPPVNAILHFASEGNPLLEPDLRAAALPDAPPPRRGEIAFAAFGKQDCHLAGRGGIGVGFRPTGEGGGLCPEPGGGLTSDVVADRVSEELLGRAAATGGPTFAIFTGDTGDAPGGAQTTVLLDKTEMPLNRNVKQRRWAELVADRLASAGLPLLGAIGNQDLSNTQVCGLVAGYAAGSPGGCTGTTQLGLAAGSSLPWREAMGAMAPWQNSALQPEGAVRFEAVRDPLSRPPPEVQVDDADDDGPLRTPTHSGNGIENVPQLRARLGSIAETHYALDATLGAGTKARVVVVDSSLRSLAASDAQQEPISTGGQLAWLERMICVKGSAAAATVPGGRCSREPDQPAIVVSNAPTYTYANLDAAQLAQDGTVLETVLLKHGVSMVVSGRMGWNGRYWATAPGVHEPCPGGEYQTTVPQPEARACGRNAGEAGLETPTPDSAAQQLADAMRGVGAPPPPAVPGVVGDPAPSLLSFVVAASAGGRFGPNGGAFGTAAEGFWRGYSIVRLDASGDPRKVIVEQRPVLDWIAIRGSVHTVRPAQKVKLRGYGREPSGIDTTIRYIDIDSPAVTHRYDLLEADPDQPWLPARDVDGEYLLLDPRVATIDQQTGAVKAGRGRQARTYAIALLSVGDKAATYPLVFEPAKSYRAKPAITQTISLAAAKLPAAQAPPPIQVLSQPATQPPATPPPAGPLPTIGNLKLPTPPQFPQLGASPSGAPTPAPPPPPVPPPPPSSGTGLPLNLNAPISPISIVPTVIPPTPPPINPAPPGGSAARKEAKQRQAATAKSEEGASEQAQDAAGDLSQQPEPPHGTAMVRRDRIKPGTSFSALTHREQPSAWARGALYGGGLTVFAFVLAAGWLTARPTPRRYPPPAAAPAWATRRRR